MKIASMDAAALDTIARALNASYASSHAYDAAMLYDDPSVTVDTVRTPARRL